MWISNSPNEYIPDNSTASTTINPEEQEWHFTLNISYEEFIEQQKQKALQHKKDCKMRNKLKRTAMFTKKGLY